MAEPRNDDGLLNLMGRGSWWASVRLAQEAHRPVGETRAALRRVQRRGLVETSGQLWRRTEPTSWNNHG